MYLDGPEKVHNYLQGQINKEGLPRGIAYENKARSEMGNRAGFYELIRLKFIIFTTYPIQSNEKAHLQTNHFCPG
jgi:hypothetical protein